MRAEVDTERTEAHSFIHLAAFYIIMDFSHLAAYLCNHTN